LLKSTQRQGKPIIVSDTSQEVVRAYHAWTKHRFEAYAEGPGQLDWDAQPAAFGRYPVPPDPVLAMTANAFAEDRERCMEAGMDDFITQPVSEDSLFVPLLHWLKKKPVIGDQESGHSRLIDHFSTRGKCPPKILPTCGAASRRWSTTLRRLR